MMFAGLLVWIVIGFICGLIASRVVNLRGDDPRLGIAVTVSAAIVGGLLCRWISGAAPALTNAWNYIVPAIASVVALLIWHIARTRGAYKQPSFRRTY